MGKRRKRTQYAHFDDIRAEIMPMIERLCELHDQTDPRKGHASETDKYDHAQRAIAIWWQLYARLMLWTQSHIIGYEIAKWNSKAIDVLAVERGSQINANSHELEGLGALWAVNRPGDDGYADPLSEKLDKAGIEFDDDTMRRVIGALLYSMSSDSSVWRFPLTNGLRALNYGETLQFLKPTKARRRGSPFKLDAARGDAIAQIYFMEGRGIKKHVAQTRIGDALAVSAETLRDWEKRLKKDDWFAFVWSAAWIAGHLKENPGLVAEDEFEVMYFGIDDNIAVARRYLAEVNPDAQLMRIKETLRRHQGKGGG
ncbi:MAG: hypothetical protein ABL901_00710 [Hyphomicrobiaceae bacterium]